MKKRNWFYRYDLFVAELASSLWSINRRAVCLANTISWWRQMIIGAEKTAGFL